MPTIKRNFAVSRKFVIRFVYNELCSLYVYREPRIQRTVFQDPDELAITAFYYIIIKTKTRSISSTKVYTLKKNRNFFSVSITQKTWLQYLFISSVQWTADLKGKFSEHVHSENSFCSILYQLQREAMHDGIWLQPIVGLHNATANKTDASEGLLGTWAQIIRLHEPDIVW